jgi:preprotein translocase subunit SecA
VVLSVIGRKWQEHLYEMDYLKEGIGLRAMAQRDPLVEYQREGFILFQAMMESIREESIGYLFNLEVEVSAPARTGLPGVTDGRGIVQAPTIKAAGLEAPAKPAQLNFIAPNAQGEAEVHVERNRTPGVPPAAKKGKRK